MSGVLVPFEALEDNDDVQEILEYIGETLTGSTLTVVEKGEGRPGPTRATAQREVASPERARLRRVRDTAAWIESELEPAERSALLRLLEQEGSGVRKR